MIGSAIAELKRRRGGITAKFLAAFAVLLAVMAGMGFFAMVKIHQVNMLSLEMRSRWLPASQMIGDIHAYTSQFRIRQSEHITAQTLHDKKRQRKLINNARVAIDGMFRDYQPLLVTAEQKTAFRKLLTDWRDFLASNDDMLFDSERPDGAEEARLHFTGDSQTAFYTMEDDILRLVDLNSKGAAELSGHSESIYRSARNIMVATVLLGLVVALCMLAFLIRVIAQPINGMADSVRKIVEGDVTVAVPALERRDELGSLARALERFKALFAADQERARADQERAVAEQARAQAEIERARAEVERARQTQTTIDALGTGLAALADGNLSYRVQEDVAGPLAKLHTDYNQAVTRLSVVLSDIVQGCEAIGCGTSEMAAAANDLSMRTEREAVVIADTSRMLASFSDTIGLSADNARQTSGRLSSALHSAEQADRKAKRAIETMRNIEASSREVVDIIATIDHLAYQTNLLALNASVEAARAGASGAGFGVVAGEVRGLAQRSAEAAKSIRQLVQKSAAQVEQGVGHVESSGDALRQIVDEMNSISSLVHEIAEAAGRQAEGMVKISSTVAAMDQAVQQNSAMAVQSSASTHSLSEETRRLVMQVSKFRLARRA